MRCLLSLSLLLTSAVSVSAADATVHLDKSDATVNVTVGDEPFATFRFGEDLPKPFFSPVRGPDGTILTRALENPKDHPHHKGLWLAVDEVNGVKFWAEQGKIRTKDVTILDASGNPARMRVTNEWLNPDGDTVVTEQTTISVYANRVIAYDIEFQAGSTPVTFEDTKEGLFGFRMVDPLREVETGKVINSDGAQGTGEAWGQPAAWVDYTGQIDGKTFGVTLFDHPENFRPSRYHVRNYGLFSISPFGEKAYTKGEQDAKPVTVPAGETLRLRYAIYVHGGDAKAARVPQVYKRYVKAAGQDS